MAYTKHKQLTESPGGAFEGQRVAGKLGASGYTDPKGSSRRNHSFLTLSKLTYVDTRDEKDSVKYGINMKNWDDSKVSKMVSDSADSDSDHVNVITRLHPNKKDPGKVPKKIHKAEREKLKRDHLNVLFSELSKALEPEYPNNGKACLLKDTIRLLGELLTQVDSLKKEHTTLLSESNYVTTEKNELEEENSALEALIKRLQCEIEEKVHLQDASISRPENNTMVQMPEDHPTFPLAGLASHSTSIVGSVYVMPLHCDSQVHARSHAEVNLPTPPSNVSKPRPRYPSSSDSWPSHILTNQTNVTE
ncbi:transcription factor bHLH [Forsythia ovata]|uniref:Transcription factor bHLH n=1 Tax=Forsythia ovata TaxID=205694 RepID=A0ABD1WRI9_9LAMI